DRHRHGRDRPAARPCPARRRRVPLRGVGGGRRDRARAGREVGGSPRPRTCGRGRGRRMTALSVALLIPWVVGVALLVMDGRRRSIRWIAVGALGATLVALGAVAADVLRAGPIVVTTGNWPLGVGITLRADALGVKFALLSVAMLTAAVTHEAFDHVAEREFPGLVLLLAAGLIGTFLTGDIFNFYVFFELALSPSYVLAIYGRTPRVLGAGLVFTAVNLLGTFVFLLSVASIYPGHGHTDTNS